jgi:uncharacterized protein
VSNFQKRVSRFVLTVFIGYLCALILIRLFERRLVFFPNYPARLSGDWNPRGLGVQNVWILPGNRTKIHAWWIPAKTAAAYTFLAFHGNAGNIADRTDTYSFLRDIPANVLAVEYEGYGKSGGNPSETALYRDADAAFDYLLETERVAPRRIISFGQSLGTAVAAHLAAEHSVGGVVLEAPFLSASVVARQKMPFLPGLSLLVRGQFDTGKELRHIREPILIVQCAADPVLSFRLGQQVYEKALEPKFFLRIDGQCHEEASLIAPDLYRTTLRHFLSGLAINNQP